MKKWSDGCGDHSCLINPPKSGMATNGGCRCFQDVGHSCLKGVRYLAKELDIANEKIREMALQSLSDFSENQELYEKYKRLEDAVRKHRDAKGHDRCWENDLELYKVLGEEIPEKSFPCKKEFLSKCEEYYNNQVKGK